MERHTKEKEVHQQVLGKLPHKCNHPHLQSTINKIIMITHHAYHYYSYINIMIIVIIIS